MSMMSRNLHKTNELFWFRQAYFANCMSFGCVDSISMRCQSELAPTRECARNIPKERTS